MELFHLWQVIVDEPYGLLMTVAIVTAMVIIALLAFLVYLRRLHPIFIWITLAGGFFGFSQSFPENRSQWKLQAVSAALGAMVITWFVMRVVRQEQRKRRHTSDRNSI